LMLTRSAILELWKEVLAWALRKSFIRYFL
jgi:hypothetical protein